MKANNILVDYDDTPDGIVVKAQLTDIEDGAHVPPDEVLFGNPVGNYMWRSPETSIEGPIQTPTDMFSFALVVSFPLFRRIPYSSELKSSMKMTVGKSNRFLISNTVHLRHS